MPLHPPIRKAIIPAAGFGTRLFPATKVVKKELFPIIDRDGRAKPVILLIVEELIQAGIEQIGIIVQESDRTLFQHLFHSPPKADLFTKLSPANQQYSQYLQQLGQRITILTQDTQEGFGHAVFCAQKWVGAEPFLLSLGDHIYQSETAQSCAGQLLEIYLQVQQSVIGLTAMPAQNIIKSGCAFGTWQKPNSILNISQLYEKPTIEYARQNLQIPGMTEDVFLGFFGLYILAPEIFTHLATNINQDYRERGEFQLTSCLAQLQQQQGMTGYIVKGKCFDTGMADAYRQTLIDFI